MTRQEGRIDPLIIIALRAKVSISKGHKSNICKNGQLIVVSFDSRWTEVPKNVERSLGWPGSVDIFMLSYINFNYT